VIRIEGLRKTFPGQDRAAVDDLSLEIEAGTFFTLLGPSGCGKSTTLRCLAGLERPDGGEIAIDGQTVFSHRARVHVAPYRRAIGMVFQSYAVWPHMTVYQNVAYPLKNLRRSRAEIDAAVRTVLRLVGLEPLASRPAPFLSGGEQQRVALARALVERPRVLLLDEPLSNLDAKLREGMRIELRELQEELSLTAVYVTHDQEEAFALSDLMAVMHRGRVVELGVPEAIYQAPATAFGAEFLGSATRLDGTVVRTDTAASLVTVRTRLGTLRCRAHTRPVDGSEVAVYVRPEEIRLVHSPPETECALVEGRLKTVAFMGGVLDWTLEAEGIELRARSLAGATGESESLRNSLHKSVRVAIGIVRCVPLAEASTAKGV
jgi:iron(III) transport system ATP-binding protein